MKKPRFDYMVEYRYKHEYSEFPYRVTFQDRDKAEDFFYTQVQDENILYVKFYEQTGFSCDDSYNFMLK